MNDSLPVPGETQRGLRQGRFLLFIALVTGIAWITPLSHGGPLALDEHAAYWVANAPDLATLFIRSQSATALPPLSAVVQRFCLAAWGKDELVFRMTSVLPFLLAIPLVYSLGRWLGGDVCGGVAAIYFANSPDILDEMRIARCYGLVVLLAAISFRLLARWLETEAWHDAICWSLASLALA